MSRLFKPGDRVKIKHGTSKILDGAIGTVVTNDWWNGTHVRLDETPEGWNGPIASVAEWNLHPYEKEYEFPKA